MSELSQVWLHAKFEVVSKPAVRRRSCQLRRYTAMFEASWQLALRSFETTSGVGRTEASFPLLPSVPDESRRHLTQQFMHHADSRDFGIG